MKFKNIFVAILLSLLLFTVISKANVKTEISSKDAILIATGVLKKNGYDVSAKDVEVLKVKEHEERGPIRLSWLIRYFPREKRDIVFNNEFWIVYFYPKGQLNEPRTLDGEYCVLIGLYTGKILAEFQVP